VPGYGSAQEQAVLSVDARIWLRRAALDPVPWGMERMFSKWRRTICGSNPSRRYFFSEHIFKLPLRLFVTPRLFQLSQKGVPGIGVDHVVLCGCLLEGEHAPVGGQAAAQVGVVQEGLLHALVDNGQGIGEGRCGQGLGGGAGEAGGDVVHGVVEDPVDVVDRVVVGGAPAGLDGAVVVAGHVDDHGAGFHELQVPPVYEMVGPGLVPEYAVDEDVCALQAPDEVLPVGVEELYVGGEFFFGHIHGAAVDVQDGDAVAEGGSQLCGAQAGVAAADDSDLRRGKARHAA